MNIRDLVHASADPLPYISLPAAIRRQREATTDRMSIVDSRMSTPNSTNAPSRSGSPPSVPRYPRKASIVLIGMRGVGKTTLAQIAAKALGWGHIDLDATFEYREKKTVADFISDNGWSTFRDVESRILEEILATHPTNKLIACGGGIVERERNRTLLRSFRDNGIVVHVMREKEPVLEYLRGCTHHPAYVHETAIDAWDRRSVLFRECCSFEFVSLTVDIPSAAAASPMAAITPEQTLALKPVEEDFFRLLRFIHGVDMNKVPVGPRTHRSYSLSLAYKDVRDAVSDLDDLSLGIDMWELRIDLLGSRDPTFLAFQVATLRRHSNLPILFTLRTVKQGGSYPDPNDQQSANALFSILQCGLRLGVEYLDVQFTYAHEVFLNLAARKGNTSIIGSHNMFGDKPWTSLEARQIYEKLAQHSDIVMMTNIARSFDDNTALRQFLSAVETIPTPLIAFNILPEGKLSRALNTTLTPVFHPRQPYITSPGQVSFVECQQILHLIGLLGARKFYVFGTPIAESMSPTIHNTAFATLGLPHSYELHETASVRPLADVLKSPSFGGASVTAPYKRVIMQFLQHVSSQARLIGAVNTITPVPGGFIGDNTDWRAMKTCILRSITPANTVTASTTALVIGAGGAARATLYALYYIGVVNIYIFNRTRPNAQILADEFNKLDSLFRIRVLDSLPVPLPIHPQPTIIISTVPAMSKSPEGPVDVDVGLQLEHFSPSGGVAVDTTYQRRITKLIALANTKKDDGWVSVEGIELLLEQGYEQFKIFTGRRAPKKVVRAKVLEMYEQNVARGFTGLSI